MPDFGNGPLTMPTSSKHGEPPLGSSQRRCVFGLLFLQESLHSLANGYTWMGFTERRFRLGKVKGASSLWLSGIGDWEFHCPVFISMATLMNKTIGQEQSAWYNLHYCEEKTPKAPLFFFCVEFLGWTRAGR